MTERRRSLEQELALLRGDTAPPRSRPRLRRATTLRLGTGRVLAVRLPEADPLSGHRGVSDGIQVAARLGDAVLACELVAEPAGPCLRGQVLSAGSSVIGALVHVRTAAGAVLACVEPSGEFMAERLPSSRILRLDLETEDGAWAMHWPGEAP